MDKNKWIEEKVKKLNERWPDGNYAKEWTIGFLQSSLSDAWDKGRDEGFAGQKALSWEPND